MPIGQTPEDTLQEIAEELEQARVELAKFKGGTAAAGTRLRKHLQQIKEHSQTLREWVLAHRVQRVQK